LIPKSVAMTTVSRVRLRSTTCVPPWECGVNPSPPEKVRETYEEALVVAREAGLEDAIAPLVEVRLADLQRLAGGSPPPDSPAA
jgi:hypothetical protein